MMAWLIHSTSEDGWWSNDEGWVTKEDATRFSAEEVAKWTDRPALMADDGTWEQESA